MVWPFGHGRAAVAAQTAPCSTSEEESSKVIARIFSPSHAPLSPAPTHTKRTVCHGAPGVKAVAPLAAATPWNADTQLDSSEGYSSTADGESSVPAGSSHQGRGWWPWWRTADASSPGGSSLGMVSDTHTEKELLLAAATSGSAREGCRLPMTAPPAEDVKTPPAITLDALPPCPIAGYTLDAKKGLVDSMTRPPHTLDARELRQLIVELSGIEQAAKYTVDTSLASQMGGRSLRAMELLVNPCLFLAGIYLMTIKTAQLYSGAVPRHSFLADHLFRVAASIARVWPTSGSSTRSVEGKERLAQQHRRLMQATNARVAFTFASGLLFFTVAAITRPSLDVVENNPEVNLGKDMVGYQQHSEASLRWLWCVYYHHPAYSKDARAILAPAVAR